MKLDLKCIVEGMMNLLFKNKQTQILLRTAYLSHASLLMAASCICRQNIQGYLVSAILYKEFLFLECLRHGGKEQLIK